jgi:hypothetical protein
MPWHSAPNFQCTFEVRETLSTDTDKTGCGCVELRHESRQSVHAVRLSTPAIATARPMQEMRYE